MRSALGPVLVFALASLILLSGESFADLAHSGRAPHRPWYARPLVEVYDPCQGTPNGLAMNVNPCPTSGGTAGTSASAGSTASTGTSASTGSTGQTTAGTDSGTTAGTDTGSTAGPPGPPSPPGPTTSGDTAGSTTGTTPPGPPGPPPDPTGGATGGATGTTTGTTSGTTSGDWDASGSGTTVDGVAEGGYVSGTNVNVFFTLRLTRPSGSKYTSGIVTKVEAQIGGEADSKFTKALTSQDGNALTPDPATGACSFTLPVRFGSTRFKDAATITLDAKFYYTLSNDGGTDQSDNTYAAATAHVVAYNKGLALATQLVASCQADANGFVYTKDPSPGEPKYDWDSMSAIPTNAAKTAAADRLSLDAGQMNHAPLGSRTSPYLDAPSTLSALNRMTAFFAYTHGDVGADGTVAFLPSIGSSQVNNDLGAATASDRLVFGGGGSAPGGAGSVVGKAVLGDGASFPIRSAQTKPIPRPNMVVLHACSGADSSAADFLHAFGLLGKDDSPGGSTIPASGVDRAGAGFPLVVQTLLFVQPTNASDPGRYLSSQAIKVYQMLLQGSTLGDAVAYVNASPSQTHPEDLRAAHSQCGSDTISEMDFKVRGDKNARLMGVYTGNNDALGTNSFGNLTWYRVLLP